MSKYDSDDKHNVGCTDSESERPAPSQAKSTDRQMGLNVCPHSADIIQNQPSTKFGLNLSTRSAHCKGNWAGHVPSKETGSDKGEKFSETPTLTTLRRNTPPIFSCHRGWAMDRRREVRLEGATTSTVNMKYVSKIESKTFKKKVR